MKRVLALAVSTVAAIATTSAFAGGPVVVVTEPVPAPVVVTTVQSADWSGGYVGLGYGTSSGDIDLPPPRQARLTAVTPPRSSRAIFGRTTPSSTALNLLIPACRTTSLPASRRRKSAARWT